MIDYEYIIEIGRNNIDIVNKITEAYEGIGNVRTIDKNRGIIKLLTNTYFLEDIEKMLTRLKNDLDIEYIVISKGNWNGDI